MDDLKELVGVVAGLPNLTVWVLAGFLAYKLAVVGSIYGVIRLALTLTHNWLTVPKPTPPAARTEITFAGKPINDGTHLNLIAQVSRLTSGTGYIHDSDVARLRRAIDWLETSEPRRP